MYIRTLAFRNTCLHASMHTCILIYIYAYIQTHVHTYAFVYTQYMYVYMLISIYIKTYICIYIKSFLQCISYHIIIFMLFNKYVSNSIKRIQIYDYIFFSFSYIRIRWIFSLFLTTIKKKKKL